MIYLSSLYESNHKVSFYKKNDNIVDAVFANSHHVKNILFFNI